MLDVFAATPAQAARWAARVRDWRVHLGWPDGPIATRLHPSGASLVAAAPEDQLLTATEVNELAWLELCADDDDVTLPHAPGHPAVFDVASSFYTMRRMAAAERQQQALRLLHEAEDRDVPVLWDDDEFTLGEGEGGRSWPLDELPTAPPWELLHGIPTALVTGSNGKTTTVRLLAAMLAADGRCVGYNCTDGVFVGGECVERGDYSGPAGARRVLRDARVQAAVLETARGGILRRGLAVRRADAAIVTNISADHFGEYGIHDLSDLANAKLAVARAITESGLLVLNADDEVLRAKAGALDCRIAWFALDDAHPFLQAQRERGGSTCGVRDGRLRLQHGGITTDLGAVAAMPLAMAGCASYNIANLAGAALLAVALGVERDAIAEVCAHFGARRGDNPGRLEQWTIRGVRVLMDYAHNPEGLDGLLRVAQALRAGKGRLGLLLGQAGNRDDESIRALARSAAAQRPAQVALKDAEGYLRGRALGEVPGILRDELLRAGLAPDAVRAWPSEFEAAQRLFEWAEADDVLVLPVHAFAAREALAEWLDAQSSESSEFRHSTA